jgi:glycosyltransferase involved in cell wall biosynthesis
VPLSDGFYEGLSCDVIHFPYQQFEICAMPSIYCPHDLQHLHYPQFFTPSTLAWRETMYPAGCRFAHTVVVPSQWVKDDVVRNYQIHPDKVQVIPWAPPTAACAAPDPAAVEQTKTKYRLEQPFTFYPAIAWPHKNHLRLLRAMAILSERDRVRVRLVCTGANEALFARVQREAEALRLQDQVSYLGAVSPAELRAVYRLAAFVIFPTLFEGGAMPILEAWQEGAPVACSAVTMMPDQAGDAALLFDPTSPESIADAMLKMWTSAPLRSELARLGAERLRHFTWERTAQAYRAVYRRAAGWPLTEEDRVLLRWDWMREPEPPR